MGELPGAGTSGVIAEPAHRRHRRRAHPHADCRDHSRRGGDLRWDRERARAGCGSQPPLAFDHRLCSGRSRRPIELGAERHDIRELARTGVCGIQLGGRSRFSPAGDVSTRVGETGFRSARTGDITGHEPHDPTAHDRDHHRHSHHQPAPDHHRAAPVDHDHHQAEEATAADHHHDEPADHHDEPDHHHHGGTPEGPLTVPGGTSPGSTPLWA